MQRFASVVALLFLIASAVAFTACGDFFVSGSTLDHINMTPTAVFLSTSPTAETKQFSAQAVNVDGSTSDVTSTATWTTGNQNFATANAGLVTAKAAGTTTVTATTNGVTGTANVVVGTAALNTTLQVTDTNNNTNNLVVPTTGLQLKATGTAGSSIDLSTLVAWTSSSTNFTVDNTGKVSVSGATSGQNATITATIATATSSATGTVTVAAAQ